MGAKEKLIKKQQDIHGKVNSTYHITHKTFDNLRTKYSLAFEEVYKLKIILKNELGQDLVLKEEQQKQKKLGNLTKAIETVEKRIRNLDTMVEKADQWNTKRIEQLRGRRRRLFF